MLLSVVSMQLYAIEFKSTLVITEGAIKTGNIGYTRRRQAKQKHNTICVGHHYTQKHK